MTGDAEAQKKQTDNQTGAEADTRQGGRRKGHFSSDLPLFAFVKYPNKRHLLPVSPPTSGFSSGPVTMGSSVFYLNKLTPANESVVSYCAVLPKEQMSLTVSKRPLQA